MANTTKKMRMLRSDEEGATLVEFALISPVFLFLLLGTFEVGYGIYMRSTLNGAIQEAGRSATLQQASNPSNRKETDDAVRAILKAVNKDLKDSDIKIERKTFVDFSNVERTEDYTDDNGNGTCDNGEPFIDKNGNGMWGTVGRVGNGGARDAVLYTVTVSYDSVFPFYGFTRDVKNSDASFTLGDMSGRRTLTAQTLLKNQPYGDQAASGAGAPAICSDTSIDDGSGYEETYNDGSIEG